MTVVRAQVTIPRDTALPEDYSVNTWHFQVTGDFADTAQLEPVHTALNTFYQAIDTYLSPLNHNPCIVKYYDLGHPKPRSPVRSTEMTLTYPTLTTSVYPEEVAMCLSYRGALVSGLPAARRRGRVFLGPVDFATGEPVTGRVHIKPAVLTAVAAAATALRAASNAAADWSWVVYSPTLAAAGGTQEAATSEVAAGWVDNVFDTQRRRGPKATARTTW